MHVFSSLYHCEGSHQGDGHLSWLSNPLPAFAELGDVRHDAEHTLRAPVHRLRLDVSEPDAEVRVEALAGELQHGDVPATVEVEVVHEGHGRHWRPHRAHPLEEGVLLLVRRDDRPVGPIVQHLLVRLFWTGCGLGRNDE